MSLNKFQLRALLRKERYTMLAQWLHNPSWFLTGIVIGNTIVNIGFGTVYTAYLIKYANVLGMKEAFASIFAFLSASLIVFMLGEILPKNIGKAMAWQCVRWCYGPLVTVISFFSPLISLVSSVERHFTGKTSESYTPQQLTREDFHSLIVSVRKDGVIKHDMETMMHAFLEIKKRTVRDVMTPRERIDAIDTAVSDAPLVRAHELGRSRIPVYTTSLDNIQGILYAKDLLSVVESGEDTDFSTLLRTPLFVSPKERVQTVFALFNTKKTHCALVRDSENTIVGFITMEDILEEVTGEILDEYDVKRIA